MNLQSTPYLAAARAEDLLLGARCRRLADSTVTSSDREVARSPRRLMRGLFLTRAASPRVTTAVVPATSPATQLCCA